MTDANGYTALHNAALRGRYETVKYLLSNSVTCDDRTNNGSLLNKAPCQILSLRFLLETGVDCRKFGLSDDYPLFYSLQKQDCAQCVKMILKCVEKRKANKG